MFCKAVNAMLLKKMKKNAGLKKQYVCREFTKGRKVLPEAYNEK